MLKRLDIPLPWHCLRKTARKTSQLPETSQYEKQQLGKKPVRQIEETEETLRH
jgi:hypothetical protein